jgi:hypothetical protein
MANEKTTEPLAVFMCTTEDFHPYECGGPPCRHCTGTKDNRHDPEKCAFCIYDATGEVP